MFASMSSMLSSLRCGRSFTGIYNSKGPSKKTTKEKIYFLDIYVTTLSIGRNVTVVLQVCYSFMFFRKVASLSNLVWYY